MAQSTRVTVLNGFLGAGKTTILLHLVQQLREARPEYRVAWLKNEFGSNAVDSLLAQQSSVEVKEVLNGCLCCTLVGQLGQGLEEMVERFAPDRIFVETSGSAYPAPLAWEIQRVAQRLQEKGSGLELDAIVCVIDCENFAGYSDTSYTAKTQAQYTDLILLNKWESQTEQRLDAVIDQVVQLNPETPRLKTDQGKVDWQLIVGADAKMAAYLLEQQSKDGTNIDVNHHRDEVDVLDVRTSKRFQREPFDKFLQSLDREEFYRVKGIVWFEQSDSPMVLNFAFGRHSWTELNPNLAPSSNTMLTFMGKGIRQRVRLLRKKLQLEAEEIKILH